MGRHYVNPARERDPHTLPSIETFQNRYGDCSHCTSTVVEDGTGEFHCDNCSAGRKDAAPEVIATGWFWWSCFPGCMPDGDPMGPFETEAAAVANAREGLDDDEGEESE